jgi:hypothetical protein
VRYVRYLPANKARAAHLCDMHTAHSSLIAIKSVPCAHPSQLVKSGVVGTVAEEDPLRFKPNPESMAAAVRVCCAALRLIHIAGLPYMFFSLRAL